MTACGLEEVEEVGFATREMLQIGSLSAAPVAVVTAEAFAFGLKKRVVVLLFVVEEKMLSWDWSGQH